MMKRIAVFGMGYVGCVTSACLGRAGHHVIGVDVDQGKLARLKQGISPVQEPGLEESLREQLAAGRLQTTPDTVEAVGSSEMALIAVGTPSRETGCVDASAVSRVVESIGQALREIDRDYVLVIRSTLLPGILEEQLAPLLEKSSGHTLGTRIHLANSPEFLRETTGIKDYENPPFILVGAEDDGIAQSVCDLYGTADSERIITDTRTAALVKYASNAFHALKVNFANEIGTLAKAFGVDGQEAMRIVCRDRQLNISPAYLQPGFAFGGSCLPKDVRALTQFAKQHALRTELLNAILPANAAHLERGLALIEEAGYRKLGLVGLSFKAGTDDLRESPLVILAETLLERGYDLKVYDPGVHTGGLTGTNLSYVEKHLPHLAAILLEKPEDLSAHSELLVLGTEIANALDPDLVTGKPILDLRSDLVVFSDKENSAE